jgi:thiopurine S-methyltransferase
MDRAFWLDRWEKGEIGFHQAEINPLLQKYWPRLGLATSSKVFVPLAGKSRDMLWLAEQGHRVLGVELSALAIEAFFDEATIKPIVEKAGAFSRYSARNITLLAGDVFDLSADDVKDVAAVYDRASLIALPPKLRARYAAHLGSILKPNAMSLLLSIEYPQHEMEGPPHSVPRDEVEAIFQSAFVVEHWETRDSLSSSENLRKRGVTKLDTTVYKLTRRA